MDLGVKDRVAVIFGGDSGIGCATAKALIDAGARVVLSDRYPDQLEKSVGQLRASSVSESQIFALAADITNVTEVGKVASRVKNDLGGADILVNCAGIRGAAGDFLKLSDEDWQQTIDVDLMGAVRVCRAFIPQMQEKGWGRLVLIASENALQPYVDESPYNACKAGIINLTKCLSRAYSREGLVINCVSPAFIKTPMTDAMMKELADERGDSVTEAVDWFLENERPNIVVERRGTADEVASVIAFLCSEHASYVTGSNYRVDGGSVESAFG